MQQINCPKCGCRLAFDDSGLDQAFECCNCRHVFPRDMSSQHIRSAVDNSRLRAKEEAWEVNSRSVSSAGVPMAVQIVIVLMSAALGAVAGTFIFKGIFDAFFDAWSAGTHSGKLAGGGMFCGGVSGFFAGMLLGVLLVFVIKAHAARNVQRSQTSNQAPR